MTFENWCLYWLEHYKKRFVRDSTYDSYLQAAAHITCRRRLRFIRLDDLQDVVNEMIDAGLAASTIKHTVTVMRQAHRKAVKLGKCKKIDFSELELPRSIGAKVKALTATEQQKILKCCSYSFYGDFFLFLMNTGLRVGEAIALRWSDIDFRAGTARIERADYRGKLHTPKTDDGKREIPLTVTALRLLQENYKIGSELCWRNTLGCKISYRSALDAYKRIIERAGIRDCGLHILRHTFATNCLAAGVDMKVLSEILGHKSIVVTANIYTDVFPAQKSDAAERLTAYLDRLLDAPQEYPTPRQRY